MRRRSTTILLAVGVVAAAALAACSSDDGDSGKSAGTTAAPQATDPSSSAAGDSTTTTIDMSGVSLKVAISTENAGGMLAEQSGVFDDAPYDIEWVDMPGSNETMEAINAGAVDVVASVQIPSVVLAQANSTTPWTADDAPFKVIAAWELRASKGFVLVVPTDSDLQTVSDLAGHTVAMAKGAFGQFFWAEASTEAGLADDAVDEVMMPAADGRTAFRAGQVDALITGYRTGLTLQDEGSGRIIASSDQYGTYSTLSLMRNGLLDDPARAAAVADLVQRLAAEDQWMKDNPDILDQAFIDKFSLTPATAKIVTSSELRTHVPLDAQTVALLQKVADTFASLGIAKSQTDVSIIIDTRIDNGLVRPS